MVVLKKDTLYNLIRGRPAELEYRVKFFTEDSINVYLPEY